MLYPSPEPADIEEIRALNTEFLSVCGRLRSPEPALARLAALGPDEQVSLARVPFLIFSLEERQDALWQRLFDGNPDLLDAPTDPAWMPITTAAIAFLWQLARRAQHDVRLFTGCSHAWCQRLATYRLMPVTNNALSLGIRPQPRFADDDAWWDRLLDACTTPESAVHDAGKMMAMQRLLLMTRSVEAPAIAARRIETVSRSI